MRIGRIHARNYRTLEALDLSISQDYCTISGKNNAGKSCIIRLLNSLLRNTLNRPWFGEESRLDYKEDCTQWCNSKDPIELSCVLCLSKNDDPALLSFVETFSERKFENEVIELSIGLRISHDDKRTTVVSVDGTQVNEQIAKEIVQKVKSSNVLMVHNSTSRQEEYWVGRGRARAVYEVPFSSDEQKELTDADKHVQKKLKSLAKSHRDDLNQMLGKLAEKYDVEFTTLEGFSTRQIPLSINLKDKHVEVPLTDWGSGTQNRTYVLMSVFNANRIKTRKSPEDKITPIVLIEEPESFLHPSAQAEFGKILQDLSSELGIQIIVSTHSPYMLNQKTPQANILLRRKISRSKMLATEHVETGSEHWMEPFAEHLGVASSEFNSWHRLFLSDKDKVLLVEGETDREYFLYVKEISGDAFGLPSDIEIVPYGGKSALVNSVLLKFVLSRLRKAFITFDLDASDELRTSLTGLGLEEGTSFMPVGIPKPGKEAIEGLLPESVFSAVFSREHDLVMQMMGSQKSDQKKEAKRKLKKLLLDEFKSRKDYSQEDLKGFVRLGQHIGQFFA